VLSVTHIFEAAD